MYVLYAVQPDSVAVSGTYYTRLKLSLANLPVIRPFVGTHKIYSNSTKYMQLHRGLHRKGVAPRSCFKCWTRDRVTV